MATPVYVEGFEHGVISASGGGLFSAVSNAPTADATIKRTGGYSMWCYKTVAAACFVAFPVQPASQTYEVGRFYVRVDAAPSTATGLLRWDTAGGVSFYITLSAARVLSASIIGGTERFGPTLSLGTWYRIDFRLYCGGATYTIDWQVEGVAQTQATLGSQAASTFSATLTRLGSSSSCTHDFHFDDVVISNTTGDYPISTLDTGVLGLPPNAAGTSNPGTYIQDNGSVVVNDATNPANVELDDVPFNGADYIKQTELDTALYAEVNFADIAETTILGAMAFLAYTSAATQANNGQTRIRDSNGQETTVFANDMSETSMFYKSAIVLTPSGGGTQAHVNALTGRVGYSSDATPDPYWQGLMIQVAYEEAAGEQHSGSSSVSGGGAIEATGNKTGKGSSTVSALGAIATLGFAAMFGISSISGGGSIATTGQKSASGISSISAGGEIVSSGGRTVFGSSSISGGGSIVATGLKDARAPTSVAGAGALSGSGTKSTTGASQISAGPGAEALGTKAGFGASEVSGGGAIVSYGTAEEAEEHSGASEVSGGGAVVSLGEKNGKGTSLVSGAGAEDATGRKSTTGASVVSDGGATLALGSKSALGASEVTGGGAITSEGHQVTFEEHSGSSVVSGGGSIESYGVKGAWHTDAVLPTPVERTAIAEDSKRMATASGKRTFEINRRRS